MVIPIILAIILSFLGILFLAGTVLSLFYKDDSDRSVRKTEE